MIVARLIGGLGNQMFQYAAARGLAINNNTSLKLDLSWFTAPDSRKYLLDNFNIKAEIATKEEIQTFTGKHDSPSRKTLWLLSRPLCDKKVFREPCFDFCGKFFKQKQQTYLKGNWQSPLYFRHIEHLLREEFTAGKPLSPSNQTFASEIRSRNAVSLHIRRGDYITNEQAQKYHGNLGMDYYMHAVELISSRTANPHFFVFSDDIDWARENIVLDYPTTFIKGGNETNCHEEMHLMSICKHNITANSTFSWWGAWLNNNADKMVIAPKNWFAEKQTNKQTMDLIPHKWLRI